MTKNTTTRDRLSIILISLLLCFNVSAQDKSKNQNTIFPLGEKAPADRFKGAVLIHPMVSLNDQLDCIIANVTFEPGARTNWHIHPGGQVLLVTDGVGYYQEKGKPGYLIHKGDVIKCTPGVEHWHGAVQDSGLTHIAIVTKSDQGDTKWLEKVTEEQYKSFK